MTAQTPKVSSSSNSTTSSAVEHSSSGSTAASFRPSESAQKAFKQQVLLTWAAWVVSRVLMIFIMLRDIGPLGDVSYYYSGVTGADPEALKEYPAVGIWPVQVLQGLMGSTEDYFHIGFIMMCLILDVLFMWFVMPRGNKRSFAAPWFWVAFGLCAMHVFVMRLDIFPGVVVGMAAYGVVRHPRVAAIALAVATAMKLWPGVLAAGLVRSKKSKATWNSIVYFLGALVLLCVIVALTVGGERIVSPLTYQGDRGLQVESILATPFAFLAVTNPGGEHTVDYTDFKTFEVFGPGVETTASICSVLLLVVVAFAFGWAVWHFFRGGWSARLTVVWMIFIVIALIVTNKVFSPQYIVWLGPLVAVALIVLPRSKYLTSIAALTIVMAALGTVVYPFYYTDIFDLPANSFIGIYALVLRNVLMLVTFVISTLWLVSATREYKKTSS